jgi:hypothetical protein
MFEDEFLTNLWILYGLNDGPFCEEVKTVKTKILTRR